MTGQSKSIYIIALEPSGDVLGARLMDALNQKNDSPIAITGVGGEAMTSAGLTSLFDPSELAILGIFEVLPKAGLVLRRVQEVLADIDKVNPDILVTIDSWGFTGRIHKALAKQGSSIKRVRYVAPQVWAWRPGRAKQLAGWIDHLLTLFPFEPPLFERHGLAATWVGHPVTEERFEGNGDRFRADKSIAADATVMTVLPGSRRAEIKSLMPVFGETIKNLAGQIDTLCVAIPTVASVERDVREWARSLPVPACVVTGEQNRDDAFAASRMAVSASGTVTLELARANLPHAIAYKVNPLSALAFRWLAKTRFVNLINVLIGNEVVPECLQHKCTASDLTTTALKLFEDQQVRANQKSAFSSVLSQLSPEGMTPSDKAAKVILDMSK